MSRIKVVTLKDSKEFWEGEELCHLYLKSDKLVFGTSYLEPGKEGAVDPGHKYGEEVFYVAKGKVLCEFSKEKRELKEGDSVIIPVGEPHKLINNYEEPALVCWALAPPDD
ncbi:MAG: cupin domain-containing protein [Candidatus Freyarchaeota archaeon]|nr:cupin domain-containing protein [Candidatus Jordarchaeia archaeon]MBS7267306.1 cupin domain-containing protein [Candidatus Jordarchaeia archaeon]MBS7278262.1 cupin domain-containing protein [Candidatus Jordarchaeia archaeon]